jgi:hypothetical protein
VSALVRRCESGRATGFAESQALVGILSTQLWHNAFVRTSWAAQSGRTGGGHVFRPETLVPAALTPRP